MKINNKEEQICIIMCTCEGAFFLEQQLGSLKKQSYKALEMLICDDNSTDETTDILKKFSKTAPFEVKLYQNKKRLGAVQNFSQAMSLCRGKYIALGNQDDIWLSGRLELTLQAMKEVEEKFGSQLPLLFHTDHAVIDKEGKVIAPTVIKSLKIMPPNNELFINRELAR